MVEPSLGAGVQSPSLILACSLTSSLGIGIAGLGIAQPLQAAADQA